MVRPRIIMLEKKVAKAGGGVCPACFSTDRRWGWVPLFRPTAGETSPYAPDGRCTSCGAEPRTIIDLMTSAFSGVAGRTTS